MATTFFDPHFLIRISSYAFAIRYLPPFGPQFIDPAKWQIDGITGRQTERERQKYRQSDSRANR